MDDLELKRWTPEPAGKTAVSPMRTIVVVAGVVAVILVAIAAAAEFFGRPAAKSADQVASEAVAEASLAPSPAVAESLPPVVAPKPVAPVVAKPVTGAPARIVKAGPVERHARVAKTTAKKTAKVVARKKAVKPVAKAPAKKKAAPGLDLDALSKFPSKPSKPR